MHKKITALVLLAFVLPLLAACDTGAAATATAVPAPTTAPAAADTPTTAPAAAAPTTAPATGGGATFALVPKNLGNPYFDTANKGAQEAAKELGVTVT